MLRLQECSDLRCRGFGFRFGVQGLGFKVLRIEWDVQDSRVYIGFRLMALQRPEQLGPINVPKLSKTYPPPIP